MGSRIRQNPDKIFELFAEIARPTEEREEPFILQTFPPNCDDEELIKSVPKFAFPCNFENAAVDHFTFVFTDIEGKYRFGFCRHTAGAHTCLCIISFLPWYEIFYKLLNKIAEILNRSDNNNPCSLLEEVYKQSTPEVGDEICASTADGKENFSFISPDINKLPTIPETRNLTEYYNAVDVQNMMIIFASMLYERRILVTSRKLSRMTACVHGCASLIYPMYWQHLYIPVLPAGLIDYVSAPMPYLIGIHSTLLEKAQKMELGDVVILDADKNTVETEYDDLGSFPSDVVSALKKKLRNQQTDKVHTTMMSGDGVARAFLKCLVALIGGYRDALKFRDGESITFDEDAFINSRSSGMKPFLEKMLQLQIFHQFINDRLDSLNAGEGFSDIFEEETTQWADKDGSSSKYKDWLGNMKKQGKKLKRDGKDMWTGITSKVKDKSKKAYKDIKLKIEELRKEEDNSFGLTRNRPATIPTVPLTTKRPPRPTLRGNLDDVKLRASSTRRRSYEKAMEQDFGRIRDEQNRRRGIFLRSSAIKHTASSPTLLTECLGSRARHYRPIEFGEEVDANAASEDEDFKHTSIGLLDDPDIQKALRKSWSCEDILGNQEMHGHLVDVDSSMDSIEDFEKYNLPVPAPRVLIRKNVSDTALHQRQFFASNDSEQPLPPPRRKKCGDEQAPLITLSSIAPDLSDYSDEDSEADDIINVDYVVYKRIEKTESGSKDETEAKKESNKVRELSQLFQYDIEKHIHEQGTGKSYELVDKAKQSRSSISRAPAFRDSMHKPVPPKRPNRRTKTEEILEKLSASQESWKSRVMKPTLEREQNTDQLHDIFDPLHTNAHVQTVPKINTFEDSFIPQTGLNELTSHEKSSNPQLSPSSVDLLSQWDLDFKQLNVEPNIEQKSSGSPSPVNLETLSQKRSPSPMGGSNVAVSGRSPRASPIPQVRGPLGQAYAQAYNQMPNANTNNKYSTQSATTLQSNFTSSINLKPNPGGMQNSNQSQNSITQISGTKIGASDTMSNVNKGANQWQTNQSKPNYSSINFADLRGSSVFGNTGIAETMKPTGQYPTAVGQIYQPGSSSVGFGMQAKSSNMAYLSKPLSAASQGAYGQSQTLPKNFGQQNVPQVQSSRNYVQPVIQRNDILKPQMSGVTSDETDLFADLDPLKNITRTQPTPKWETFDS